MLLQQPDQADLTVARFLFPFQSGRGVVKEKPTSLRMSQCVKCGSRNFLFRNVSPQIYVVDQAWVLYN